MSGIADKPGAYNNFTGTIKYKHTDCRVRNATFEILEKPRWFKGVKTISILFEDGDVITGKMCNVIAQKCNFYGSTFSYSVFHSGIFKGGEFYMSYWYDGDWQGKFWRDSFDKFGRDHLYPPPFDRFDKAYNTIIQPGRYANFTGWVKYDDVNFYIKDGELEVGDSIFHSIIINGGTITKGHIKKATINQVIFKGDTIEKSTWYDGTWQSGTWFSGEWLGGVWLGGIWHDGDWYRGYDKYGSHHGKDDSPDKWAI